MTNSWLVPFTGRNESDVWSQNFVWKKDDIYIMDNHRAALCCWLQQLNASDKYKLLHIDRHYDAPNNGKNLPTFKLESLFNITLDEYLSLSYSSSTGEKYPFFQYDNYMWPLFPGNSSLVSEFIFATHNDGEEPNFDEFDKIYPWDLLNLGCRFKNLKHKWIVNIDIDYFFHDFFRQNEPIYIRLFSDRYIERVFSSIKYHYQKGRIAVLTIALSPEFCGGWNNAEDLCTSICKIMDVPFNLPK